ncbi:MAG: hypothetical protein HY541_06110 [Deltaproteobacteria bacterium]|nr:hypothetical protein [Deltaproteobacteria bacterium]MBI4412038.1 hypothetical protein [Deltaproteobacteria bacterium]
MKKSKKTQKWRMLPEYDFHGGVRGKYAGRYARGTNVVVLEPDVARNFPDSRSVNKALRELSHFIRQQAREAHLV